MIKYVSIQQLEGGYIVTTDNSNQIIVTSLNKAVKIIREYLGEAGTETAAE